MTKPQLIITADDYGMSPLFNRGVEELASIGLITGVSVMIKRPFIEPNSLDFPKLALGLHLELEPTSPEGEIQNQIALFQEKFGKLPAYLDGHQHQHLTTHNLPLIIEAARHFHLPVRSRFDEDRNLLQQQHIATPDTFISWHPTRLPSLEQKLAEATEHNLSELVVHPGYFDPGCSYPYNKEREAELSFIKSYFFRELIAPFELFTYSQI